MSKLSGKRILMLIAAGVLSVNLLGCGTKMYNVDYHGQESLFSNAKSSYKAGDLVLLYFDIIATDTDYFFFVDNESYNASYIEGKGYEIRFIMPDHDTSVYYDSQNTMVYIPSR